MGGVKALMMEREDNIALATEYLVSKGRLTRCRYHGTVYGGGDDKFESDFWRNAMIERKRGHNGPIPWASEMEAKEVTDLVTAAYKEHWADSCYGCDQLMAD